MPDAATRALLNEEMRERMAVHRAATERVETKATILLGFSVTALQFLFDRGGDSGWRNLSVGAFLVAIGLALVVVLVRASGELDPAVYLEQLWNVSPPAAASELARARLHQFEWNRRRHRWRVGLWRGSACALTAGAMMSAAHFYVGRTG